MNASGRIDAIKKMLETEPDDLFLNYSLGIEYVSNELHKEAIIQFNKSLSINPDYFTAHYQLGKLFEHMNVPDKAIHHYKLGLATAIKLKHNKAINEFNEALFLIED